MANARHVVRVGQIPVRRRFVRQWHLQCSERQPRVSARPSAGPIALAALATASLFALAVAANVSGADRPDACPPYCPTPIITPAWHLHMCDMSYEEQLPDNHCMNGPGITEFPDGTDSVYTIYCHKNTDTVIVQIKDTGGGLQYVNHPDGETYEGEACESLIWWPRSGIPSAGSPYFTSASWPEGPFSGVGAGIEWYIGLFIAFDQEHYYGNGAEAEITARDPAANLGPAVRDVITATVTSTSDPIGIEITLHEKYPSFPVFTADRTLRFSQFASNEAESTLLVSDHDEIRVSYCPRECAEPYTDTAIWYQLEATITPTPLPTWPGPPPTLTPTPPPDLDVSYLVLRPAAADVGYVPQISTNPDRPNHLGYPSIYSGAWTRGRNQHYGMIQFELGRLPSGADVRDARLEIVGRESRFAEPGLWEAQVLDESLDLNWRNASYPDVDAAPVIGTLGAPMTLSVLAVDRTNSLGFSQQLLSILRTRAASTGRLSIRIKGPESEDNNLFAWHSGVDVYGRESVPPDPLLGPSLHIAYVEGGGVIEPTPTIASPTSTVSVSPPTPTPTRSPTHTRTVTVPPSDTPGPPTTSTSAPSQTLAITATPTASANPPAGGALLCILAFDDTDGDDRRDPGERLLPGVTVRLTHVESGAFVDRTTDGANDPDYCWDGLTEGAYTIAIESLPNGYEPTGASVRDLHVPFPFTPASVAFGARSIRAQTPGATPDPRSTASATASAAATAVRGRELFLPLVVTARGRSH